MYDKDGRIGHHKLNSIKKIGWEWCGGWDHSYVCVCVCVCVEWTVNELGEVLDCSVCFIPD